MKEDVALGIGIAIGGIGVGVGIAAIIIAFGAAIAIHNGSVQWERVVQPSGQVCIAVRLEDGPSLLCPIDGER